MDFLDELDEKARRATARARRLAALLRDAGVNVSSISEATQEADAAVNLGEHEHIQVGVDGTYTRVKVEGESFVFEPPVSSARSVVALVVGAAGASGEGASV